MRPCWLYALFKCHNQTFVGQNLPSLCFGNTNAFSSIFKQFGVREDKKKTNNNNNSNNNNNKIGPDGSLRRRRLPTRQSDSFRDEWLARG